MRLVGATPFGSKATLDRGPWKGADGGLRTLLVLCFLYKNYSLTATIGSDTIQCSTRAGTMVILVSSSLSKPGTLAVAGAPRTIPYFRSDYSHIMPYFIRLFPHYASSVNVPIMPKTMPA